MIVSRSIPVRLTRAFGRTLLYALVISGAVVVSVPFFWQISTSLKDIKEVFQFPPKWIPSTLHWENYPNGWKAMPFTLYLRNSLYLTFACVVGRVASSSLIAYAFARLRAPGRDFLFVVLLSGIMIPAQVTMIPMYMFFRKLGWVNTFKPLIVPQYFGGGAANIFLLRQFYLTIPLELDDAARIDGASNFGIYWRIMLPLARPALAAVAIFAFMFHWQDFMGPLIYLSAEKYTLALGLRYFMEAAGSGGLVMWNQLMAVSTLIMMPSLIIFFVAQRIFIQGIVITGVKG